MSMRILVVGAGATGGYFGGRLLQAGRDVTFLVRPKRAAELAASGLAIRSPFGNAALPSPTTVTADNLRDRFDLVILSCKAYDIEDAISAFAPAVGADTAILPLLNGMRHLDVLDDRFGRSRVLGGLCAIAATLDEQRVIVHLNDLHILTFGERDVCNPDRIQRLASLLTDAGFSGRRSEHIAQDMWDKWVFLATLASATCMMRASVGDILATAGGENIVLSLLDECRGIAESEGFPPRPEFMERTRAMLTAKDSTLTSSMLRDIESNSRIEADHVVGDLLRRRRGNGAEFVSLLKVAFAHLKSYEARRGRDVSPRE
jgi:2-dehydropantoate 2-reductase